jgi:hypothetical protein
MISMGCALAAYGEVHFEMFGFLCQASAVAVSLSKSLIWVLLTITVRSIVSYLVFNKYEQKLIR